MNELDAPLGLDGGGHDRAHNRAAIAVFGLTGFAILAAGVAWFGLRYSAAEAPVAVDFAAPAVSVVPADAPVLRQEVREEPVTASAGRSITIIDGKTGKRETINVGPDIDGPDDDPASIPR